jgi:hypothetical protein
VEQVYEQFGKLNQYKNHHQMIFQNNLLRYHTDLLEVRLQRLLSNRQDYHILFYND